MLSPRITKALAVGILVLASIALVLFVASVFSQDEPFLRSSYQEVYDCQQGSRSGCMTDNKHRWEGEFPQGGMSDGIDAAASTSRKTNMIFPIEEVTPVVSKGSVVSTDRKVASTASLDLRTKSLDWTVGKIRDIAKNVGGFVESANINQPEWGLKSAWITVKVPADRFDTALAEMKQTADQVVNENAGATDVTAQYIDLSARINNKRAEEKAYENLLGSTTKVTDVIEVTEQLTNVRTEIESLEQQLRYLEGQTTLATISLSVTEDPQVQANPGEFQRGNVFKAALNTLVDALLSLGSGLVVFLISGLPVLLIIFGLIWVVYRTARRIVGRMFGE